MLNEWMVRPGLTEVTGNFAAAEKAVEAGKTPKMVLVHATTTRCLRSVPDTWETRDAEWVTAELAEQVRRESEKEPRTTGFCESCVLIRKTAKSVQPKPDLGAVTAAYLAQLRAGRTHVDHDRLAARVADGTVTEKGKAAILAAEEAGKAAPSEPGPIVASSEQRAAARRQGKPDATTKATIAKRGKSRSKQPAAA